MLFVSFFSVISDIYLESYLACIHYSRPMQWYSVSYAGDNACASMRAAICVSIANVYLSRLNVLK